MNKFQRRKSAISVSFLAMVFIIIGVILRCVYLNDYSSSPLFDQVIGPDCSEYFDWAKRIIHGQFLYKEVDIHAPGYAYFLAALMKITNTNIYWMRFIQLFLGMLSLLVLYFSLERTVGVYRRMREVSFIFLAISMCYVPMFFYQAEFLSESLLLIVMPLLISCLIYYNLYRHKSKFKALIFLAIGAFLGSFTVIVHPLSLSFVGLLGVMYLWQNLWYLIKGKKYHLKNIFTAFLPTIVYGIFSLSLIVTVVSYNTKLAGHFVPIQKNSGYNLYLGNNASSTGGCYIWPGPMWEKIHGEAQREADQKKVTKNDIFVDRTKEFIYTNPSQWAEKLGQKALLTWNHYGMSAGPDLYELRYYTLISRVAKWFFAVVAVFGFFALLMAITKRERSLKLYQEPILIILGAWIALTITVTGERYRIMILVPLFILAAVGANLLYRKYQNSMKISLTQLAFLVIAIALVVMPVAPKDLSTEKALSSSMLGEAFLLEKEGELAEKMLKEAIAAKPNWARNYNVLGKYYLEQKNISAAVGQFTKALQYEKTNCYAYMNLGTIAAEQKEYRKAYKYFLQALKFSSENEDKAKALYNLGLMEINAKQLKLAVKHLAEAYELMNFDEKIVNAYCVALLRLKQYDKAQTILESAVKNFPNNIKIHYALAYVYKHKNMTKELKDIGKIITSLKKAQKPK
ncbi:tetratricopeptide repeat protein [Lentisphaerota bacterium WC36G]|nr:tetratricopeptide repeat protein [Lentisphaerae bacterium WC36]